jgi:Dolichyl-phosphate-mannose-protein mannosyltransferase
VAKNTRSTWFRSHAPIVGILFLGLVLRLAGAAEYWHWFDQEHPDTWKVSKLALSQDGSQYVQQADPRTWASQLHREWAHRAFFRPPLPSYYFDALINAVRFNRLAIAAVQSLLAILAYWLIYLVVARRLGRGVATATLVVLCVHPVLMFFDSSLEDSSLALLCVAAAIFAADWARDGAPARWVPVGIATGLAILARPQFAFVAAGLATLAWLATSQGKAKAVTAFFVPILWLVFPAIWHNHHANGRWSLVSDTFGQNMYWGNGPNPEYRTSLLGYWNIWEVDRACPMALLSAGLKVRTGQATADAAYLAEALRHMDDHPVSAMAEVGRKVWRHLSNYEIPRTCDFSSLRKNVPVWQLPYLPYSLVLGLAVLGLRGVDRRLAFIFILPVIGSLGTEVVFFNASRYRALGLPFLVSFGVRGVVAIASDIRKRHWNRLFVSSATLTVLLVLGSVAVRESERNRHLAVQHYMEAMLESYSDEDRSWLRFSEERFQRHLALARRLDPSNLDAFSVEQKMLIRSGQVEEALQNIKERRASCQPGEWLCQAVCDQLETMAKM